ICEPRRKLSVILGARGSPNKLALPGAGRASVRRHRSHLERNRRRALNWQSLDLPTATWRCGRLHLPRFAAPWPGPFSEKRRRLIRSPPTRSRTGPHPVASDTGLALVGFRLFSRPLAPSTRERLLIDHAPWWRDFLSG